MGYRIYLGQISNDRYEKIKNVKNYKQLFPILKGNLKEVTFDEEYIGVYDISEGYLHEFGKYIDWTEDLLNKCSENVFLNKDFNDYVTQEHDFFIINKLGLEHIINEYNLEMGKYYNIQYALSNLLMFLTDTKKDRSDNIIKQYKEIHKNCWNIINEDDFMYLKYDLKEFLDLSFEDFFNSDKKEIIDQIIIDIVAKQNSYFGSQYAEYRNAFNENDRKHYDLSENKLKLTHSWKKDLNILELVNIYKDFDWNNNKMLIYGY